jgi:hypothetical protein
MTANFPNPFINFLILILKEEQKGESYAQNRGAVAKKT